MMRSRRALLAPFLIVLSFAFAQQAVAAPGALTWKPKKPAAGQKVTVTGKGFKKRAKYKITVNDVVYKRSYRTSRHGKLKFSFRMPQIEQGGAIFVGAKIGKTYRLAEIFISDLPPVAPPQTKSCEGSAYAPDADGKCPDFDLDNEIDAEFGGEDD